LVKDRSIFRMSTGNWRRYVNDEYPVPKSSMASRTPVRLSSTNRSLMAVLSSSSTLSVISRVKVGGDSPQRFRASCTSSTNDASCS
jgi:hypothetical protein